jgi:DNA-binding CsgD family transcriptional regulator
VSSMVVGRGVGVDLQLNDESVSRRHASLRLGEDDLSIEDLRSRNGTWVNGTVISSPVCLTLGDRITIGSHAFVLVSPSAEREKIDVERVTQPIIADPTARALAPLSPRERTVFPLLAGGLSQREIAARCGVSVKTVETYRTRISHKLGLQNRAELIRYALDAGVLRPNAGN